MHWIWQWRVRDNVSGFRTRVIWLEIQDISCTVTVVEWRIEYFREPSGRVPIQEFIDRLTGEEQIDDNGWH
jgi:hypothetical protein